MLLYVHFSIAIILMGKRELIALLNLASWCLMMVERLFLAVPRGCLQFVIVVFPDHTHLLFFRVFCEGKLVATVIIPHFMFAHDSNVWVLVLPYSASSLTSIIAIMACTFLHNPFLIRFYIQYRCDFWHFI